MNTEVWEPEENELQKARTKALEARQELFEATSKSREANWMLVRALVDKRHYECLSINWSMVNRLK
jgi:hypothetical protein